MPTSLNCHDFHGFDDRIQLTCRQSLLARFLLEAVITRLNLSYLEPSDHGSITAMCAHYRDISHRQVILSDDEIFEAAIKETFIDKSRINKAMSDIAVQSVWVKHDDEIDEYLIFECFEYEAGQNKFTFTLEIMPYLFFLLNQCEKVA